MGVFNHALSKIYILLSLLSLSLFFGAVLFFPLSNPSLLFLLLLCSFHFLSRNCTSAAGRLKKEKKWDVSNHPNKRMRTRQTDRQTLRQTDKQTKASLFYCPRDLLSTSSFRHARDTRTQPRFTWCIHSKKKKLLLLVEFRGGMNNTKMYLCFAFVYKIIIDVGMTAFFQRGIFIS